MVMGSFGGNDPFPRSLPLCVVFVPRYALSQDYDQAKSRRCLLVNKEYRRRLNHSPFAFTLLALWVDFLPNSIELPESELHSTKSHTLNPDSMNRRNSITSRGLRRHKSTSSSYNQVHLEHIRVDTAEHQACTAASQAFSRAIKRSNSEVPLWPPPRPNHRAGSTKPQNNASPRDSNLPLRHHESVRFVQSRTNLDQSETLDKEAPTNSDQPNVELARAKKTEYRSSTSASANGMVSAAKGTAGDYISALLASEEYYTPEDDIASAPSSYRKIRRSRSMFTTSEPTPRAVFAGQSRCPITTARFHQCGSRRPRSNTQDGVFESGLKGPRSISYLRSRQEHDEPSSDEHKPPILSAYIDCAESLGDSGPIFDSQASLSFRLISPSSNKTFRKTLRNISPKNPSTAINLSKNGSFRKKARRVSHHVKHSIKSFFSSGRATSDKVTIPPQHIEARATHISQIDELNSGTESTFHVNLSDVEGSFSQVTSDVPSLHAVSSRQQLHSRHGSVESLHSDRKVSDEKSRVTSWSNSDANTQSTLSSHRSDWERQRLSVINKNGTHVSSSSARRFAATPDHCILPKANSDFSEPVRVPPVDGQKVFSALVKRIHETNASPSGLSTSQTHITADYGQMENPTPKQSDSSRHTVHMTGSSPVTIRQVAPTNDTNDQVALSSASPITPRDFCLSGQSVNTDGSVEWLSNDRPSTSSSLPTIEESKPGQNPRSLTSPALIEPCKPRTLSARSSAFFGSPTCHLFRTRSPYRKALQNSMKVAAEIPDPKSPEFNPWMRSLSSLPLRRLSVCGSEVDRKMQYAKSIYSHVETEEPMDQSTHASSLVQKFPEPPCVHDDATIFLDPPAHHRTPKFMPKHRKGPSLSSVEWRNWLSANMSPLETTPGNESQYSLNCAELQVPRLSGHVREYAQINNDECGDGNYGTRSLQSDATFDMPVTRHCDSPAREKPLNSTHKPSSSMVYKENQRPRNLSSPSRTDRQDPFQETNAQTQNLTLDQSPDETKASKGNYTPEIPPGLGSKSNGCNTAGIEVRSNQRQLHCRQYKLSNTSPGIGAAVDRQFGKLLSSPDLKHELNPENVAKKISISPKTHSNGESVGAGINDDVQAQGSKKMVEAFLSTRRRGVAGSDDESDVFL